MIVVTQPDNVDLIKDVLDQLDKIPEQVMIQTIIVEATLDKAKQFGLEWNFAQNKAFGNTGTTGTGSQNFGLQTANPPLQGFDYALTGGDLTAFFNMLQTDTKFQVLSTPRIFTSNNMEARIQPEHSVHCQHDREHERDHELQPTPSRMSASCSPLLPAPATAT